MKGTAPIITCDAEDGCDAWTIDYYSALASNWRELMPGWQYEPRSDDVPMLCPAHVAALPRPVPAAVFVPPRRLRSCVEAWPDAETGAYHPSCCRFPKSCSATVYDPARVTAEDLESPS